MPLSLDKRNETSNKNALPMLHPSRVEEMVFVRYTPPPSSVEDSADYDAWLERINYLCDDLHWLLQLPHDKFWCQVIFDESLHKALDSFLKYCPRYYDSVIDLPEAGQHSQQELCRLVYLTYLRMATHKESKEHFITPEVFGDIIYENFLFDIPKILDICSLFGKGNGPLLTKMISNIFTQQPKYTDDLRETVPTMLHVLTTIATQCGVQLEISGHSPQKLDKAAAGSNMSSMPTPVLQDILLYLNDIALTLHRFLELYPPACNVLHEFNFCSVIAHFYEHVIPELTLTIKQKDFQSQSLQKQLQKKLHRAKKCLVHIFRSIIQYNCLQPLLDNGSDEQIVATCMEGLIHTMTSVLNERKFLASYESMFSFQDDVDMLMQTSTSIDPHQLEYIQSAINAAFATFGHRKSPRGDTNTGGRTSPDGAADSLTVLSVKVKNKQNEDDSQCFYDDSLPNEFQTEDYSEGAVSCPTPGQAEIESLIASVKDLFPHIGEGFIELALEELDWNHEKVVSAILEDKLPSSLQGISFDVARQERAVNQGDGHAELPDVLATRRNIFDNDEFDLFHNKKVDMKKIHLGKKKEKIDLEDKSVIRAVQATYDAYGSIDQDSMYEAAQMYEDEYDDTYDSNIAADDDDSADELTNKKVLPRVLLELERKKEKEEASDSRSEESEEEEENEVSRDLFLTDPAKLREMAEQKRLSQASRGRRGRGGAGPPRVRDVVGSAKGQGQSDEVKRNRRMKEKFKGQRNKANSEKKMSKGMF
ncbi:activating signal cointegrator 1 complex subunit 2 [Biomphalaria pfeifferi]|uniref:Activating signal cointegrator 1 complex subunit 2 n=1 Tax=Biomphalaria pfeifferi TaxID=112525 RepID=A0AAD8EZI2_BIOPF|nr:activating signal cointegrator 1 complex subunit 2 [Biomphalaria pfeifferi]